MDMGQSASWYDNLCRGSSRMLPALLTVLLVAACANGSVVSLVPVATLPLPEAETQKTSGATPELSIPPSTGAAAGAAGSSQSSSKHGAKPGKAAPPAYPAAADKAVTKGTTDQAAHGKEATATGSAAYFIPRQMVEQHAAWVDLWIDRAAPLATLKQELAAKLQIDEARIKTRSVRDAPPSAGVLTQEISDATIPIGDTMLAELRGGDDFDIEPKGLVMQSLKGENRGKWNWRVKPKHASDPDGMALDLDIWIDPGPGKRLIDSYHESVVVTARARTWLEIAKDFNEWLTLLGLGGIGGIVAWLVQRFRRRK